MTPVLGEIVGWELLLVLLLIALLFGSSKLPGLARSMGQATKEFRKGIEDGASTTTTPSPRSRRQARRQVRRRQADGLVANPEASARAALPSGAADEAPGGHVRRACERSEPSSWPLGQAFRQSVRGRTWCGRRGR